MCTREYHLGPYQVIEHIERDVAPYRWRVIAYDAARVLVDTQWVAPTIEEAQKQLACAVNYTKYVLTGDTMALADGLGS
ncbi:MAG TPA: hypothetical protein VKZ50_10990 [bacterium]|nr:hypothetical protein [bacterium]